MTETIKAGETLGVPCKTILLEIEIPVDPYMGLGNDEYYRLFGANQCANVAARAIAEYYFGCPAKVSEDPELFTWQPDNSAGPRT